MRLDLPALAAALGADPSPGWLGDALTALHPGSSTLAVAYRHRLALVSVPPQAPPRLLVAMDAVTPPEAVTALRWVVFASTSGSGRASTRPPRSPAGATAAATATTTTAPLPLNAKTTPRLEEGCLLVGTSSGYLQVHAERAAAAAAAATSSAAASTSSGSSSHHRGRLLHRQRVHAGPVVSLRLRPAGAGLDPVALDDDISITAPEAVARLAAVEARAVARVGSGPGAGAGGGGGGGDWRARLAALPPLGVQKWEIGGRGVGPRTDGVVLGPRLPRLRDALDGRSGGAGTSAGGGGRLVILTAGASPALAAHDAEEHAPRGTAALVADLAASVAAGLLGAARAAVTGREGGLRAGIRSWVVGKATGGGSRPASAAPPDGPSAWDPSSRPASAASSRPSSGAASPSTTPGRPGSAGWAPGGGGGGGEAPAAPEKLEPPPVGEATTLWRAFSDPTRRVTALHPAPAGALAAAADALGRILLVDGSDGGRVVRVWKGYRGAQLAWALLSPASAAAAAAAASPSTAAAARAAAAAHAGEPVDAVNMLVLIAYAPRRGVVEGWCPRTGARLGVARVGDGGPGVPACLVSPDAVLGLGGGRGTPGGVGPRDAWLVDSVSGEIVSVVGMMERGWRV